MWKTTLIVLHRFLSSSRHLLQVLEEPGANCAATLWRSSRRSKASECQRHRFDYFNVTSLSITVALPPTAHPNLELELQYMVALRPIPDQLGLFDPRGPVHATADFLPTTTLSRAFCGYCIERILCSDRGVCL